MYSHKHTLLFGGLLAIAACGGAQGSGPGDQPVPAMDGEIQCYRGTAAIDIGGTKSKSEVYLRRAYDAGKGKITEDAVTRLDSGPSRTWTEIMTSQGNESWSVTGAYRGGKYSGTGKGAGESGAWTEWSIATEMDVGPKVTSEYKMEGKDIVSTSEVSSGPGPAQMTVKQRVSPISAEQCQIAFSHWEPL